jgi:tetratricopeptide (TPR) repeat protein
MNNFKIFISVVILFLSGCGKWNDIQWVAERYAIETGKTNPKKRYDEYLSKMSQKYISIEEYKKFYSGNPSNVTQVTKVSEILDTDQNNFKRVLTDDGDELTFVLEDGKWKRCWNVLLKKKALDAYQAGSYSDAVLLETKALEIDPYDIEARTSFSFIYRDNKEAPNNIENAFIQAKEAEANLKFSKSKMVIYKVYYTLGSRYSEAKNFEYSNKYFKKAWEVAPDIFESNFHYGLSLFMNNMQVEGFSRLKMAYKLEPENPLIINLMNGLNRHDKSRITGD